MICTASNYTIYHGVHTSEVKKKAMEFTLNVSEPILGLHLDTTVVRNKKGGGFNWSNDITWTFQLHLRRASRNQRRRFTWRPWRMGESSTKSAIWARSKAFVPWRKLKGQGVLRKVCQATCLKTCPCDCFQYPSQKFPKRWRKASPFVKKCQ